MLVVTNVRTSDTLELDIDVDSLRPQDSGAREAASVELDLYDEALAFELLPEDPITVSTVASPSDLLFGGFIRSLSTDVIAIGRKYHLIAYDYGTLLDRINVVQIDRPAGESDHDRLAFFMTTFGSGLLDDDPAGIATLNASMPAQKFRQITLRQAIEQVLGTALTTGTYRINASAKLDTWDSDPGLGPAPYDIVLGTPGGGELAPEELSITADTTELYNAYWVRGATAAGSGWFTDAASIAQWGRREKFIDAPDSDLSWKAFNVGMAALADTKQPKYRGTFTVYDGDWRSNQRFALTSPIHGPAGGFTAEPFDTVRVTRKYLSGEAREAYEVEFGSPKGSFSAKHGKEARRADGVGPGSGGWGFGGGFGGAGVGGAGGVVDCGCPDFEASCPFTTYDDDDRTNASAWGNVSSSPNPTWAGSIVSSGPGPGGLVVLNDSMVPTHGLMRLSNAQAKFGEAEERIAGPGFWSSGDWKLRTSVKVVNTNADGWYVQVGTAIVLWGRNDGGPGVPQLRVDNNGSTNVVAMAVGTFDGMGFINVELRRNGSTITAIVAGVQLSTSNFDPPGADDDLVFVMSGVTVVGGGTGGAEVHFGPIDAAVCGDVPSDGQHYVQQATGDGSTTGYNMSYPFHSVSSVLVDGVDVTSDVTASSPTLTFGHAPPAGSKIVARLMAVAS